MPFVLGGDIFGLIRDRGALGEINGRFYTGQVVLALEYLHTMDIIYRWGEAYDNVTSVSSAGTKNICGESLIPKKLISKKSHQLFSMPNTL